MLNVTMTPALVNERLPSPPSNCKGIKDGRRFVSLLVPAWCLVEKDSIREENVKYYISQI